MEMHVKQLYNLQNRFLIRKTEKTRKKYPERTGDKKAQMLANNNNKTMAIGVLQKNSNYRVNV